MLSFPLIRFLLVALSFFTAVYLPAQDSSACRQLLDRSLKLYSSDPDSSFALATEALSCAERSAAPLMKARALSYQGKYYLLKSDLETSQKKLGEAQLIYSEYKDYNGLAYVLKLKSILQGRIGNEADAVALLEEAISMYRKGGDHDGLRAALLNISLDYLQAKDFERAENCLQEVRSMLGNDTVQNFYYYLQNMGKLRMEQGRMEEAAEFLTAASKVAVRMKMVDSQATVNTMLGEVYTLMKQYGRADSCLQVAEDISVGSKLEHELLEVYEARIRMYRDQGKFREAYETLEKATELRNKLINLEKVNSIASLEKKLIVAEKEKQLEQEKTQTAEARAATERLLYITLAVVLFLIITAVMFVRTRRLKNQISAQNNVLEEKNSIIEARNRDITDSITYAGSIQRSILPDHSALSALLPDHFVMYRPKDIVSGDFYWAGQSGSRIIIAVADCTGHGVPGALMSVIGTNLLNEAVHEHGITEPAAILNRMRRNLIAFFRKNGEGREVKDGMDISVIMYDPQQRKLEFAGAYNSLYHVRNGVMTEYAADKAPVGIYLSEESTSFTNHTIDYLSGDVIYLLTDGYADQFGGEKGKKFKYRQLKEKLSAMGHEPLSRQKDLLEKTFDDWKGPMEQIDDVLVMGIRL